MPVWPIVFMVGIFLVACGALCALWLLLENAQPQHKEKPHKKSLLSNWK